MFVGIPLALMAPYLGFAIYYSQRFPPNHVPSWFTNTLAIWFSANFLIGMLLLRLMRRVFPSQVVDPEKSRVFLQSMVRYSTRLVILWVGLNILGKHIREATTEMGDESRRLAPTGQCTPEPQDAAVAGSIFDTRR
jgi:small-conductance mechanosensitive channel